jgi:hypothetical protein
MDDSRGFEDRSSETRETRPEADRFTRSKAEEQNLRLLALELNARLTKA